MSQKDYRYKISVVMAVYNTVEYLDEAMESVIHQTMDFKEIQVILVDDGSTDGSGELCDQYLEKYPDNVVVVHQENAGRAAASNAGLPYIQGKYVNFLDSDDAFSEDTFALAYDFMECHGNETDLVSVPMIYFDAKEGDHFLNYKYEKGTRVADWNEEYDVVQMHLGSSFIHHDVAKSMHFDTSQVMGIDARECMRILRNKMTVGLLKEGVYHYRIRESEKLSIMQAGRFKPKRYTYHLENYSMYIMDYYQEKCGVVPKSVQYAVMYDLQGRIRQKEIPEGVLDDAAMAEYKERMHDVLLRIEDGIILEQRNLNHSQKIVALSLKYGVEPKFEPDGMITVNGVKTYSLSQMTVMLDGVKTISDGLEISGFMNMVGVSKEDDVELLMKVGNDVIALQQTEILANETWLAKFNDHYHFIGVIPKVCFKNGLEVVFETKINNTKYDRKVVKFQSDVKADDKGKVVGEGSYILRRKKGGILKLSMKPSLMKRLVRKVKKI